MSRDTKEGLSYAFWFFAASAICGWFQGYAGQASGFFQVSFVGFLILAVLSLVCALVGWMYSQ